MLVPAKSEATEPVEGETPAAESKASETLTRAEFDAWTATHSKKMNGELASLRKKIAPPAAEQQPAEPKTASLDDLRISRELGRLEASIGGDVLEDLGEEYSSATPAQQLLILRGVQAGMSKKKSGDDAESGSRGGTPVVKRTNARAEAPLPRDTTPRPRSQQEHQALRTSNPRAFKALMEDDTYDPGKLPWA